MDGYNALYEQTYDTHDVLGWRCLVEDDRIVEFDEQSMGTAFDKLAPYAMLNGEYLTLDDGEECTPIKDPEWNDIVSYDFGGDEQEARDSYEQRVVVYDDDLLFA